MALVDSGIDHVITGMRQIRDILNSFDELMAAQTVAIQGMTAQLTRIANFWDKKVDDEVPPSP